MSDIMTTYVLGFCFNADVTWPEVVLIEKQKPEWQRGKLNGVGGKVEDNENPTEAMAREFLEETGAVALKPWQLFATLVFKNDIVHCFSVIDHGAVEAAHTMTDESVFRVSMDEIAITPTTYLPNLQWLLPMALDAVKNTTNTLLVIYEAFQVS